MAKYPLEIKIAACKDYFERNMSMGDICDKYGIPYGNGPSSSVLSDWFIRFAESGEAAFYRAKGNNQYLSTSKMDAVLEYLSGNGTLREIAAKYGIQSKETLRRWVMDYNANRELKDYDPKREVYMAEARRKTTIEERKEIVKYCIEHDRDYKGTASLYDVSYTQVYSWVRKYDADGEDALIDKRGHHKTDDEVDELERLRRENNRLKRQLEEKDMLVTLLKKVKELEGM